MWDIRMSCAVCLTDVAGRALLMPSEPFGCHYRLEGGAPLLQPNSFRSHHCYHIIPCTPGRKFITSNRPPVPPSPCLSFRCQQCLALQETTTLRTSPPYSIRKYICGQGILSSRPRFKRTAPSTSECPGMLSDSLTGPGFIFCTLKSSSKSKPRQNLVGQGSSATSTAIPTDSGTTISSWSSTFQSHGSSTRSLYRGMNRPTVFPVPYGRFTTRMTGPTSTWCITTTSATISRIPNSGPFLWPLWCPAKQGNLQGGSDGTGESTAPGLKGQTQDGTPLRVFLAVQGHVCQVPGTSEAEERLDMMEVWRTRRDRLWVFLMMGGLV